MILSRSSEIHTRTRRHSSHLSPACGPCHGAGGTGEPPAIPYLAGQYAHYTAFEFDMWRRGLRRDSPEATALFAGKLDDEEFKALAAYCQQARPSAVAALPKE